MQENHEKAKEQARVNHVLEVIEKKLHTLEEKTGG